MRPGSDDNVTRGERLNLTFDRAGGHVPRFEHGDRIDLAVDGARYDDVPTALDGRFFSVTVHAAPKPVPEPASALLIGISVGIMGLVLARRAGPDVHRAWRGQGPRREPFRPPRPAPCRLRLARIDPVALGSRAVCEVGTVEPRTLAVLIVAGTTPLPRPLAGAERLLTR